MPLHYPVQPDPRTTKIVEIDTAGIDEAAANFATDPYGSVASAGLRVPTLATPYSSATAFRYLFLLCTFSVPENSRARIHGYRQYATIGYDVNTGQEGEPYIMEEEILTPNWHFPDGNISWHLRRLGPPGAQGFPQAGPANRSFTANFDSRADVQNMKYRYTTGPALLYNQWDGPSDYYTQLTSYTPPNSGRPWGTALAAGIQNTFYDLRTSWRTPNAWHSLNVEVEGPETVAFFASVRQTNPHLRSIPTSLPTNFYSLALPEEKFVNAFNTGGGQQNQGPIYWRVGGALIAEIL